MKKGKQRGAGRKGTGATRNPIAGPVRGTARVLVAPGLEEMLADELEALELSCVVTEGAVLADVDLRDLYAIHLYSRLGARVMFEVGESGAGSLEAMYQGARKINWKQYLSADDVVTISISIKGGRLKVKPAIEKKLRLALSDALRTRGRPPKRARPNKHRLHVRIQGQRAWFSLDASGEHLYRRGWREHVSKAPIRENLAAAILAYAQWSPGEPLVDPMCGSGTIPIEAGCIAHGIAPGSQRTFGFETWPCHDASTFGQMRRESRQGFGAVATPGLILGGDVDERVIRAATHNVHKAGLEHEVLFQVSPFRNLQAPGEPGLVVMNPPYGRRVSESSRLRQLYQHIGDVLRTRWAGWRIAILVPQRSLLTDLNLPLIEVASFRNGGISVALMTGRV
jgi:putative N6-adenine-specific DNA methylase